LDLRRALAATLTRTDEDPATSVVVLRGAGRSKVLDCRGVLPNIDRVEAQGIVSGVSMRKAELDSKDAVDKQNPTAKRGSTRMKSGRIVVVNRHARYSRSP
jgi:enoyl-CoA hydratase/carnithine racemase